MVGTSLHWPFEIVDNRLSFVVLIKEISLSFRNKSLQLKSLRKTKRRTSGMYKSTALIFSCFDFMQPLFVCSAVSATRNTGQGRCSPSTLKSCWNFSRKGRHRCRALHNSSSCTATHSPILAKICNRSTSLNPKERDRWDKCPKGLFKLLRLHVMLCPQITLNCTKCTVLHSSIPQTHRLIDPESRSLT